MIQKHVNQNTTISDTIKLLSSYLNGSYNNHYNIAIKLLSYSFRMSKTELLLNMDNYLDTKQLKITESILNKVKEDYPISYILGNIEFYKEIYTVNEAVLIPRPETELLVEEAIKFIDSHNSHLSVLEIGTGSGCISISILNNIEFMNVQILATDNSPETLKVARENADRNLQYSLKNKLLFQRQDFLTESPTGEFDLIISNPPYIPYEEYLNLDKSLFYEPKTALTDMEDGLLFYKRLAYLIKQKLKKGGLGIFEIHSSKAEIILHLFKEILSDKYRLCILKDIFGRDRIIKINYL